MKRSLPTAVTRLVRQLRRRWPAARIGRAGLAAGVVAPVALLGAGCIQVVACAAPSVGAGAAALAGLPDRSTVTLVTGDRVRVAPASDGSPVVTPLTPSGAAAKDGAGFLRFGWGVDQYVVPDNAVPYLGTLLDPRLFDVTYLVRAKLDDAHRATVPVTVRAATTKAAEALPALHVTHAAGASATATVRKKDAAAFGRLLAEHWRAARNAPNDPAADALTGVSGISLAVGAGAPPAPVLPAGLSAGGKDGERHFHTLTVKFVGMDGRPTTGAGWVQNVDDARLSTFLVTPSLASFPPLQTNPAGRLSVPDGTYSLAFGVVTPHPGTFLGVDSAVVARPEIDVHEDMTVTFDARDAKPYRVSLDKTVDVEARQDQITLSRTSLTGGSCGGQASAPLLAAYSMSGAGTVDSALAASPTGTVKKGEFDFDAMSVLNGARLNAPAPPAAPRYTLDFPRRGAIPASLDFHVRAADLTAMHERVYAHPFGEQNLELLPMVFHPWRDNTGQSAYVEPGERTDYLYTSDPKLTTYEMRYFANDGSSQFSTRFTVEHGQQLDTSWGKGPAVPSRAAPPTGITYSAQPLRTDPRETVVTAARQDDNAMLYLAPAGDSDPAHYGYAVDTDLRFYRDGTLVETGASQPGGLGTDGIVLPLSATKTTYRLDVDTSDESDLIGAGDAQTVDTSWTFGSGRGDAKAQLPDGVLCAPDPTRACSLLPLLFVRYDLALDYRSRAEADAPFDIAFAVAHQEHAPGPKGVTATVSVSYDDGKTWSTPHDATAAGDGTFRLTVHHPPAAQTSGYVSLRVDAHDADGSEVRQTVIRAYALTGTPTDKRGEAGR